MTNPKLPDKELREQIKALCWGEGKVLETNVDRVMGLVSTAKQQLLTELKEKIQAKRQDEHPTEDGVPVETYGYEETHNEALAQAISLIEQKLGELK